MSINRYVSAYSMLIEELNSKGSSKELIKLSGLLSQKLDRKARDLAHNKATEMSKELYETEALLKLVNKIN